MSRKPGKLSALVELAEDILFLPNPVQRKCKARFWSRYEPNPLSDDQSQISLATAQAVTGESGLARWWSTPGFKDWFLNSEESRERLEYLFNVALDTAETILTNPDANDNARVQMVKVIAQLAGKEPQRTVEKYADDEIQRMTEGQLRAYLEKKKVGTISVGRSETSDGITAETHETSADEPDSPEGNRPS